MATPGKHRFRYGAQEFFHAYGQAVVRAGAVLRGEAKALPSVKDERFLLCASGLFGMKTGAWSADYADALAAEVQTLRTTGGQ